MRCCCAVLLVGLCFLQVKAQYYNILTRVIQGSQTSIERYPVLAQLLLDPFGSQEFTQHCAGVILTSRHVLSAAHCFQYNPATGRNYSLTKYWKMRVGSSYRSGGGFLHSLKKIILHKDYDQNSLANDISVVMVLNPFLLSNYVRQATIMRQGSEIMPNSLCTLVGWGVTEPDGAQPNQLQHTTLFTVDQNVCAARYQTIGVAIQDSMMCAGHVDTGGPDGCFGDSGGPLICGGLIVGTVSFGYSCGHRFFPGVYTKVSYYTNWIMKTVYDNK